MEGFAELYRSSAADVYAYVATLLGDRAAAEDVTAQAFERAWRKRGSLRRAARGRPCVDLRHRPQRGAGRAAPAAPRRSAPPEPVIDDGADDLVRRMTVRAALAGLEPRDRELIALKFHGGLSNGELARLLRTSESNVGTRLHRAVAKLREACHVEA